MKDHNYTCTLYTHLLQMFPEKRQYRIVCLQRIALPLIIVKVHVTMLATFNGGHDNLNSVSVRCSGVHTLVRW